MKRSRMAGVIGVWACLLVAGCATDPDRAYFMGTPSRANVFVAPGGASIRKVAVLPFKAPTELIGASVADMFVTELLRVGKCELVERTQLSQVLNEAELALAGLSTAKAVEVANMVGADGVIVGTVSEYETIARNGKPRPVAGVSARLIECRTSKIVWSVDLADKAETSDTSLAEHGRHVVHEMAAGLYQRMERSRQ